MHPILIEWGRFQLPSYGVFVAAGYLAGILWLKKQAKFIGLSEDHFWSLVYRLFFGAIAGGKLLYIAVEYQDFLSGRLGLIRDFRYGFIFFGGFLGAVLMGYASRRRLSFNFAAAADYFAAALPLGHAIGRLGCLAAGCCYGRPTRLPWGLALGGHPASIAPQELWGVPLHPTQIYESLGNAAIFALLTTRVLPRIRAGTLPAGSGFFRYALCYSLLRFLIEFLRWDERGAFAGLSTSQWFSLAAVAAAAFFWARARLAAGRRA